MKVPGLKCWANGDGAAIGKRIHNGNADGRKRLVYGKLTSSFSCRQG